MAGPSSPFERRDFPLLVAASLVFFVLVLASVLREERAEWRPLQGEFIKVLERHGQVEAARGFMLGIRQIWIPEMRRVDRCVTCHLGYEWAGILRDDLPQPFAPHPKLLYTEAHPFSEFGCSSCHGGQGFATRARAAHGQVEHWEEPLLGNALAKEYGLTASELMQTRCNGCHRRETSTPGMELVNRGKALYRAKKCVVCHAIEGRGGLVAPELTYIGDKNPELFDFSHISGPRTVLNWHVEHLISAETVTRGTTMPTYNLEPEDARALALLLLSWRRLPFPPRYLPGPAEAPSAAPLKVVREVAVPPSLPGLDAGRHVFLGKGCNSCHSVGAGVLIGPDLKGVGARRDADWLRRWLANPAAMIRAYPELSAWPAEYGSIVMPDQNLTSEEIEALVAYLAKL